MAPPECHGAVFVEDVAPVRVQEGQQESRQNVIDYFGEDQEPLAAGAGRP
jgi:hypothetical protein